MSAAVQPRTHLLTGAGSGIGKVVADRLHSRGDRLVLVARDERRADTLAERWPGARSLVADLSRPEQLASAWPADLDRLDSLVHSAGVVGIGAVAELSVESWQRQLTVNLVAAAELIRLALPALRTARGTVVCLNSGSGIDAKPGWSAYAASKFGLRALAESLREEESEHGVRVCSVFPGRVATPMQEDLHAQEGKEYDAERWIRPETVADAVVLAVDAPRDAVVSDIRIRVT